jgi:hypothetical protein
MITRALTIAAVAVAFSLGTDSTSFVYAQAPSSLTTIDCGTAPGGVVRGTVRSAETGAPKRFMRVAVGQGRGCTATVSQGDFEFRGVAAGAYTVNVLNATSREFDPIPITVRAGDTLQLDLRVRIRDDLAHCKDEDACVRLVSGNSGATDRLSSEQQLRAMAFRTVIALGLKASVSPMPDWYACINEPDTAVFAAVKAIHAKTVNRDACTSRLVPGDRRERMVLAATSEPAMGVGIDGIRIDSPTARTVHVSYGVGPLWAAGWACKFELREARWEAVRCVLTIIS